MAFSFDVASNIPRLNQSGTDTGLSGIATSTNVTDSKNEIIAEVQNIDLTGVALESTAQAIKTKTDTLENTDLTGVALESTSQELLTMVDSINLSNLENGLNVINENVKDASLFIPADRNI